MHLLADKQMVWKQPCWQAGPVISQGFAPIWLKLRHLMSAQCLHHYLAVTAGVGVMAAFNMDTTVHITSNSQSDFTLPV